MGAYPLQRSQPVSAECLETRDLRLDRHSLVGDSVDHLHTEALIAPRAAAGSRLETGDDRRREKLDAGIESHAQCARGALDRVREAIAEVHDRKGIEDRAAAMRSAAVASDESSSGTGWVHRPGRPRAAETSCAHSPSSGSRIGAGRSNAAANDTISDSISSRASPTRGILRRPTTRPPAHAKACTKRSSTSGASTTPERPAAVRSRANVAVTRLTAAELIAQRRRLLEPPVVGERAHPRLDRGGGIHQRVAL